MTKKKTSHILVVDDEMSMRELLEMMLTREGYKVSCAESGLSAIEMIKKNQDEISQVVNQRVSENLKEIKEAIGKLS